MLHKVIEQIIENEKYNALKKYLDAMIIWSSSNSGVYPLDIQNTYQIPIVLKILYYWLTE